MATTATTYTPNVLCSTEGMTEQEWLGWRTTGIGGSDAGTILGVNPYRTKLDLYNDKIGIEPIEPQDSDALPLRWGHALERVVAEEFSRKTGLYVYEVKEMYQHPLYKFMQANVDRFIRLPDGTEGILECKTANPNSKVKWEDGKIPPSYEAQVRHYLSVMNIETAYIACLFENNSETMAIRKIVRDLDKEAQLIKAEQVFWEEHVVKRVPPTLEGEDSELAFNTLNKFVQRQINKKPVTITGFDESLTQIADLKAKKKVLEDQCKAFDKEIDALLVPIIESLGQNTDGTATVDDTVYNVSYRPSERTGIGKDDLVKLKINHSDVYDEYVSATTSYRKSFTSKPVKK